MTRLANAIKEISGGLVCFVIAGVAGYGLVLLLGAIKGSMQ